MFLAPSRYDLGESLLITTLLGIPLGEPDGKTPTQVETLEQDNSTLKDKASKLQEKTKAAAKEKKGTLFLL